jgi:hypothetical protein
MRRGILQVCLLAGTLSFAGPHAGAQQIVHALVGTVTAVYPEGKTIQIATDDGSQGRFDILTRKDVQIDFSKNIRALTTPADSFTKANCQVVVFYFGDESMRTTVAVEDLGQGPLVKSVGTVVKLDKKAHILTIKNDSGEEQAFLIDAKTVADAMSGVVEGQKFSPDKGEKVRITAAMENGTQTALFIRALSL